MPFWWPFEINLWSLWQITKAPKVNKKSVRNFWQTCWANRARTTWVTVFAGRAWVSILAGLSGATCEWIDELNFLKISFVKKLFKTKAYLISILNYRKSESPLIVLGYKIHLFNDAWVYSIQTDTSSKWTAYDTLFSPLIIKLDLGSKSPKGLNSHTFTCTFSSSTTF